jgi:hypothetical protein
MREYKRELVKHGARTRMYGPKTRFPPAAERRSFAKEPYPTESALRSSQRQSPDLGLLSKEASLVLQKVRGK